MHISQSTDYIQMIRRGQIQEFSINIKEQETRLER